MSDLGARARAIASKQGLRGSQQEQRITAWFAVNTALTNLRPFLFEKSSQTASKEFADLLFWTTVMASLWGDDIIDIAAAAIDQREMAARTPVPGTTAPVPNAASNDGTLRDTATGEGPNWS